MLRRPKHSKIEVVVHKEEEEDVSLLTHRLVLWKKMAELANTPNTGLTHGI
jgi:hypothetical protein